MLMHESAEASQAIICDLLIATEIEQPSNLVQRRFIRDGLVYFKLAEMSIRHTDNQPSTFLFFKFLP